MSEIERIGSATGMIDGSETLQAVGAFTAPRNLDRRGAGRGRNGPRERGFGVIGETRSILAGFRRIRAGDRGLIAAPWTPLASLWFRSGRRSCCVAHAVMI